MPCVFTIFLRACRRTSYFPLQQEGGFAEVRFFKAKDTGELFALKTGKVSILLHFILLV